MKNNAWERLKWLWLSYLEMRKKAYPLATLGTKLIIASLSVVSIFNLAIRATIPEGYIINDVTYSTGEISLYSMLLGFITLIVGVMLIHADIRNLARNTAKVLITGMKGTSVRFPSELLSKSEKRDSRETVQLSISESDSSSLEDQISLYNSELAVGLYSRFILHNDCNRVYLGGLARVPFLVAYGACFRAVSTKVIYFDKFHRNSEWKLLNDESDQLTFDSYDIRNIKPNLNGDIGIALSFSNEIKSFHLPESIRENTIMMTSGNKVEKNLIKNQENLHSLTESLKAIIDNLSILEGCKKIHLFLAVQSTFALDIGRRYQEGTHKNWVIHNFNAAEGKYEWAIEISKTGITQYNH
ncbi:MAG: SAVED domain-containing protein [Gammaproteobacteria bacterium]|nr:SAVED domain-containing protein [Gammaproteobacteria bacterium]